MLKILTWTINLIQWGEMLGCKLLHYIYGCKIYHIDNNNNFLCVNGYTYHVMELLVYKTWRGPLKHLCDLGTNFYHLLETSKKKLR